MGASTVAVTARDDSRRSSAPRGGRLGGEPQGASPRGGSGKAFFRDAREAVRERARRVVSRDGGRERVRQRRATRAQPRTTRRAPRRRQSRRSPRARSPPSAQQRGERSQTALGALGARAEARPGFRGGGGGDALGTERSQRERLTFCVLVHSNWFNLVWLRDKRFGIRSARAERDEAAASRGPATARASRASPPPARAPTRRLGAPGDDSTRRVGSTHHASRVSIPRWRRSARKTF